MSPVPFPDSPLYARGYPIVTALLRLRPFNRSDVDALYFKSEPRGPRALSIRPGDEPRGMCRSRPSLEANQIAFTSEGDEIPLAERTANDRLTRSR